MESTEEVKYLERLNKFIASNGFSSRRKIDEFIIEGRVTVNGKTVVDLGHKIDPMNDKVAVDGERIKPSDKKIYLMMNKPDGVVSTVSDEKRRPTVIDILNTNVKIFPIGRLDFHTTGLLLLTNDGEFANKLMNPSFKVWKTYDVKLSKPLEQKHRLLLEKGIRLEGRYTLPAKITIPNERDYSKVIISITEGKNKQVRRMFEHFGYFVNALHRSEYGNLKLGNLRLGEIRKLTKEEVENLTAKDKNVVKAVSSERPARENSGEFKKEFKRAPSKVFRDKKNPGRDFSKKFEKRDSGSYSSENKDSKKDFSKKFSEGKSRGYAKDSSKGYSKDKNSRSDFKKKFSDDKPRENKIDYKKKFSNDTRADKRPRKGYEDDFSDRPKGSFRDDDFIKKDSKPGFKKKFSKEAPKKFSKDSRSKDFKPGYKKKLKKDDVRNFTNNNKEKKFDGTKRPDKKKIRRA